MPIDHSLACGIVNHKIRSVAKNQEAINHVIASDLYPFIASQFKNARKMRPADFNRTASMVIAKLKGNTALAHLEFRPMTATKDGVLRMRYVVPVKDKCARNGSEGKTFSDTNLYLRCLTINAGQKRIRHRSWTAPVAVTGHYFDRYVERTGKTDFSEADVGAIVQNATAVGTAALRTMLHGHLKADNPVVIPHAGGLGAAGFTFQAESFPASDIKFSRSGPCSESDAFKTPSNFVMSLKTFIDAPKLTDHAIGFGRAATDVYHDLLSGKWAADPELLYGCPRPGEDSQAAFDEMVPKWKKFGAVMNRAELTDSFRAKWVETDVSRNRWASTTLSRQALDTSIHQMLPPKFVEKLTGRFEFIRHGETDILDYREPETRPVAAGKIRDVIMHC